MRFVTAKKLASYFYQSLASGILFVPFNTNKDFPASCYINPYLKAVEGFYYGIISAAFVKLQIMKVLIIFIQSVGIILSIEQRKGISYIEILE